MTVHDDLAERLAGVEELVANPHQVFGLLVAQRHAGTDAGMDEEIVAGRVRKRQALEKGPMVLGQAFDKLPADVLQPIDLIARLLMHIDPVGIECGFAAEKRLRQCIDEADGIVVNAGAHLVPVSDQFRPGRWA